MRLSGVCLVIGLLMSGCGGSDSQFTRESIEERVTTAISANVAREGGTMIDAFTCVEDRSELYWLCTTDVRIKEQLYGTTVKVTCDRSSGDCISQPAAFVPKG